jgi:hypothetical protein
MTTTVGDPTLKVNPRQIFISYSSKDRVFVHVLHEYLKELGYELWIDHSGLDAGDRFDDEIAKELEKSQIVLVILSADAIASNWVKDEIAYAQTKQKHILPILYRPCEMPPSLIRLHYINIVNESVTFALTRLRENLDKHVGKPQKAIVPLAVEPNYDSKALFNVFTSLYKVAAHFKQAVEPLDITQYLSDNGFMEPADAIVLNRLITEHEVMIDRQFKPE